MLSDMEKQELLEMAGSKSIRDELRRIATGRHNPILCKEKVDLDRYIEFLNDYNDFINHQHRPFRPMVDQLMKL